MIKSTAFDKSFPKEVMAEPGGEQLVVCSSCGTCAAACVVRQQNPEYNPRRILRMAALGLREKVLSSEEIWQCSACDDCYPRCPKGIHISEVMGAIRQIAIREGYTRPGATAQVNVNRCVACGMCAAACPYEAIKLEEIMIRRSPKRVAQVDPNLCAGCGICNAVCPSGSISLEGYTDREVHDVLLEAMPPDWSGRLLVIICNWSLHAGSDITFAENPPEGVQVIRVSCSGRVTPTFVTTAFDRGAEGVLVVGCDEEECHYREGSRIASGRLQVLGSLLDMMGVDAARVRFTRLTSLDRGKLPTMAQEQQAQLSELGPLDWKGTGGRS